MLILKNPLYSGNLKLLPFLNFASHNFFAPASKNRGHIVLPLPSVHSSVTNISCKLNISLLLQNYSVTILIFGMKGTFPGARFSQTHLVLDPFSTKLSQTYLRLT